MPERSTHCCPKCWERTADIYAIVLTHQIRHPFAQLVLASYQQHWPDNGLVFRVPYSAGIPRWVTPQRVEFVPAEPPIKHTMAALLNGIPDDEFVYWSTDDRYLSRVYDPAVLRRLHGFVQSDVPKQFDSLRLVNHTRRGVRRPALGIHRHQAALARGFWHHQFIRAGVLRRIFVDGRPDAYEIADTGRELVQGKHVHTAYSATRSIVQFGEPTIGPEITTNGEADCRRYGIELPTGYGRIALRQYFPDDRRRWVSRIRRDN